MRLSELQHGRAMTLVVRASGVARLHAAVDRPLALCPPTFGGGPFMAGRDQAGELRTWTIAGDGSVHVHELERIFDRGCPLIAYAVLAGKDDGDAMAGRLILQVHEFTTEHTWLEPLRIGVGDKAVAAVQRAVGGANPSKLSVERVSELLASWLLLPTIEGDHEVAAVTTLGEGAIERAERSFWLHGKARSVKVVKESDGSLQVDRVTPLPRGAGGDHDPWQLMRGALSFVDVTSATALRAAASAELDALVRGAGSYLRQWSQYNEIERRRVLDRARRAGAVRYSEVRPTSSGEWQFTCDQRDREALRALTDDRTESLTAAARIPEELTPGSTAELPRDRKARSGFVGEIRAIDEAHMTIDLGGARPGVPEPPDSGFLFLSLVGDQTRLNRREVARDAIISSSCAMPQLGLLLEGRPVHVASRPTHWTIPQSVEARFSASPTARQCDALRVAMNTPDIALIQGPPGTGKTEVIAALATWLAEEAKTGSELAKSILLTSYQHDAVDNAAARSTVLDLPALRVGGSEDEADEVPMAWARELARKLRRDVTARDGGILVLARALQTDIRAYALLARRPSETATALEDVAVGGIDLLSRGLRVRLLQRADELRQPPRDRADHRNEVALDRALEGLRTTPAGFDDDGPRMAARLVLALDRAGRGADADRVLLRRAAALDEVDDDTLEQLAELRTRVRGERAAERRPPSAGPIHDDVSRKLLAEAAREAAEVEQRSQDGIGKVLADFSDDLDADVLGVRRTLGHYTSVLAASCQQSAGHAMAMEKASGVEFATVIVDEAARANPLDLMIPLAQARRRIVLIGDHRQLPHILEPEIERELDADVAEETRAALRQSLFERLYEDLAARERTDGIKRVVTLDRQFRMHPVLGEFVNRSFYAPHGTPLLSPRPASDFPVSLPVTGAAPAAWIDLPSSEGGERSHRSKSRLAEARWIAGHLETMMRAAPTLSFGVISFYTAQDQAIAEELEPSGLTVRSRTGKLKVEPKWSHGYDDHGQPMTRLRIGTVDTFQGREFDVVLLSPARSSPRRGTGTPKQLQRRFGHLMLENRLCVAMSRQRRALIVVGDAAQMTDAQGVVAVPALGEFHAICNGEHGVIVRP